MHKVKIYTVKEASDKIPVLNCPYFKNEPGHKFGEINGYKNFKDQWSQNSVLVYRNKEVVGYKKVVNQVYNIGDDRKYVDEKTQCKIPYWWWKPKIVWFHKNRDIIAVKSAIKEMKISYPVHQFMFSYNLGISSISWYLNKNNKFEFILQLLEIDKNCKIKVPGFSFYCEIENENSNILISKATEYYFLYNKKFYRFQCDDNLTHLKGFVYDFDDEHGNLIMKWEKIRFRSFTKISKADSSLFKPDLYWHLPNSESKDYLNLHVFIKKTDINELICNNLENLQKIWNCPNITKIEFGYHLEKLGSKFLNELESIPKYIKIDIKLNVISLFIKYLPFWKCLTMFKKVKLNIGMFDFLLSNSEDQELDQVNTHKKVIKISEAYKDISLTILMIQDLINKNYFKKLTDYE